MRNDKLDILLEKADFTCYSDFCLIFRVLQWNVF